MYEDQRSAYEVIKPGIFEVPGMDFYSVMVDGGIARELLARFNRAARVGKEGTNRKLSKVRVDGYANEIRQGEWFHNPQPIIIAGPEFTEDGSEDEEVTDGQHRLEAVVQVSDEDPELRVPMVICIGAPRKAKMVLDRGKARVPGDFLGMEGEANPAWMAAATRMLYTYLEVPFKSINVWQAVKLTPNQLKAYLENNVRLRQGMKEALKVKSLVQPYVVAVFFDVCSKEYDVYKAVEFISALEKGIVEGVQLGDARWKLREYFGMLRARREKSNGYEQLGLLILAFNDWVTGSETFRPSQAHGRLRTANKFPRVLEKSSLENSKFL